MADNTVKLESDELYSEINVQQANIQSLILKKESLQLFSPNNTSTLGIHLMEPWGGVGPSAEHPKHGLAFKDGWKLETSSAEEASLSFRYSGELSAAFQLDYKISLSAAKVILERKLTALEDGVLNAGGIHPYFSQRLAISPEGPLARLKAKKYIDNQSNQLSSPADIPEHLDYSNSRNPKADSCSQYLGWDGTAEIEYTDGLKITLKDEGRNLANYEELQHITLWRSPLEREVIGIEPSLAALASCNNQNSNVDGLSVRKLAQGESSSYLASFEFTRNT